MPALFLIASLTMATFLPAVNVDNGVSFDKDKIKVEAVYEFNE